MASRPAKRSGAGSPRPPTPGGAGSPRPPTPGGAGSPRPPTPGGAGSPRPPTGAGRENRHSGDFLDQHADLAALAVKQHGVFGLGQLRAIGLTDAAVHNRAARGRLHRVHRAVYSLVPPGLLSPKGHWMAAVLACGPGAVLSHASAAALHGLRPSSARKIDVTVPRRSSRAHRGVRIHRSTTLTGADATVVDGIPCTTIARTLLDLAGAVARRGLERAFDQAEAMDELNLLAIQDQLARNATRREAARVRALLTQYYIGSAPTESELEEAFFALCRRAGLPLPQVQQWLILPDGGPPIRADFLWRDARVVVETDGARYHGTAQARQRDPRRDQRLIVHAWLPMRTTWRQIMHRPRELEATLRELIGGTRAPVRPLRASRRRPSRAA